MNPDLIEPQPDFIAPARSRQIVRVSRLVGYRLSDYQRLVKFAVAGLSGQGPELIPPGLSDQLPHWLAFLLICSGVCQTHPPSVLTELTWDDIPFDPALPLRLPRPGRRSYVWLGLSPLVRLLLLATAFREREFSPRGHLFTPAAGVLGKSLRLWLADLCRSAGVPVLKLWCLEQFVRLDLLQTLPNLNLAVLLGYVPFTPAPADHLLESLQLASSVERPSEADFRQAALGVGHLPAAMRAYLNTLDLRSVELLKTRPSPLNSPEMHLPLRVCAAWLGQTSHCVVQMVRDYNAAGEDLSDPINLQTPGSLPDGARPAHRGQPADYLSVKDALRLVRWALGKQGRCLSYTARSADLSPGGVSDG